MVKTLNNYLEQGYLRLSKINKINLKQMMLQHLREVTERTVQKIKNKLYKRALLKVILITTFSKAKLTSLKLIFKELVELEQFCKIKVKAVRCSLKVKLRRLKLSNQINKHLNRMTNLMKSTLQLMHYGELKTLSHSKIPCRNLISATWLSRRCGVITDQTQCKIQSKRIEKCLRH